MNADPEQFEQVRRLLSLKRHEQPPPGYFNDFSARVMARIEAGEQGGRESWFQRFWAMLEARPIFAGAFGSGICAVLISGILNSGEVGVPGLAAGENPLTAQTSPAMGVPGPGIATSWEAQTVASTNPVSSLFNQIQIHTAPVSLNISRPGGN